MKRLLRNVFATIVALTAGTLYVSAQTDVTSTYLTNADFEGNYTSYIKPKSDRDIYQPNGWTIEYTNGESNDMTSLNSSCTQWNQFSSRQKPVNGGNNVYWIRYRWGSSSNIKISQTTNLPAGTYRLSADAFWNNNSNSTATISAAGHGVNVNGRNAWANYAVVFTLGEPTDVEMSFTFKQTGGDENIAGVDNFKLEKFDQSVTDLSWSWTTMMANPGFELGTATSNTNAVNVPYGYTVSSTLEGWKDGSINKTNPSEGSQLYNFWAGTITSTDMHQTVTLPMGKYTIAADLRTEEGKVNDQGVYAKVGSDSFKSGTITTIGDPWNGADAWNNLSKTFYVTADNTSVDLGASSTGGANSVGWYQIDNFTLTYHGAVAKVANSFSQESATSISSNTWYAITIPADGEYTFTTTTATKIYSTNDGYKSPGDVMDNFDLSVGSQTKTLTAGTLYFRSTTATTLTITPNTYSYNVGSASVDKEYVQSGETVTVTFIVETNNSSATFAKNGNPTITFNNVTVDVTPTTNGFTFAVPTGLNVDTEYSLSIPADAFGYVAGNTYNEAQTITFHTPALFDGTYYFKVAGTTTNLSDVNTSAAVVGKYLARSNDWGTHAAADNYGLAISVTTDNNNYSLLQVYDTKRWYFTEGNWDVYSDGLTDKGDSRKMIISKNNGKLLISGMNSSDKYFKCNNAGITSSNVSIYYDGTGTNSGPILLWEVESPTDHQAVMASYKDAQAVAAATAAVTGDASAYTALSSVTTLAELESAAQNLGFSGVIIGGNAPTSVKEKYQGGQPNPAPETVYSDELVIPEPGLYKFSMQAFYRSANNEVTQDMHTKNVDCPPVVLFLGEAETQIKSLYDEVGGSSPYVEGNDAQYNGMYYANNMDAALMMFQESKYHNDVWFYFSEPGTYEYGVKYMGFANANMQWFIYSPESVTVTYYGTATIRIVDGIATVLGNNSVTDINNALTSDIAVLDLEQATGLNNTEIDTYNNGNLLIYANSGQVNNSQNVIVNGTCTYLKLRKSNSPFFVPKAFTASQAEYRVVDADLAGGEYATLMIPFESSVPTGKAYTLDQGVSALGGEINATEVTTVPANSPVLVTGSGQFTTSNVEIPVIDNGATYTSGELVGVYKATQAPVGSYVLQNHASSPNGVAFYLVNDVQPNVGPFRAYIKSQTNGAKAYRINFGDDSTRIATIDSEGNISFDGAEYFTVGGARVNTLQKGVNILKFKDGTVKKVIIK